MQACSMSTITHYYSCLPAFQEGEICPRTPAQFDIVFKPEEAKLYQQTIYCDITGQCQAVKHVFSLHIPELSTTRIFTIQ